MAFEANNIYGGQKKGMAEYRSQLTREAYEEDPSKCLNVIRNIIRDAEKGDPVCRKIFAQSYMTKAPAEMQITHASTNLSASEIETDKLISFYQAKGYTEVQAADMVLASVEAEKAFQDQHDD